MVDSILFMFRMVENKKELNVEISYLKKLKIDITDN
jgi:hypothetical protein